MIHLCWVFQRAFFRRCLLVCCTRVAVCAILRVDMKHNTPQLPILPLRRSRGAVFAGRRRKTDVEFVLFENLTLTEATSPADVSKLPLYRLPHQRHCAGARRVHRLRSHCDCSNVNLQKASLERTRLSDCKLVGATLSEAFLLDVSLIDCIARYSFSSSKIRHTRFTDCDLSHAARKRLQAGKDRIRTLPAHSGGVVSNTVCRHGSLRLRHFRHRDPAARGRNARVNLEQAAHRRAARGCCAGGSGAAARAS